MRSRGSVFAKPSASAPPLHGHSNAHARAAPKDRIDALTGLRALAATWVVLFHFKQEIVTFFPDLPAPVFGLVNTGWLGVDVFFVLSGFVIAYNYAASFETFDAATYRRYLWLRLARIYPLHLFALACYAALLALASLGFGSVNNPEDFSLSSLALYLLLIQAWGFGLEGWNKPAWSITAEWFAYLTFPVTRAFTSRLNASGLLACSVVALAVVPIAASLATGPAVHFVNLVRVVCEFTVGTCLFFLYQRGVGRGLEWRVVTPLAVLLVPAVAVACDILKLTPYWTTLPIAFMVFALTQRRSFVTDLLGSRPLVFWGQVSYAVYLTHLLTRSVIARVLKPEAWADAHFLVEVGILLAFGAGVAADITTPSGRAQVLAACATPDILVNNAGGPPRGDFREWNEADWAKAVNANMVTPIMLIKAVIDGMIARRFGRIVNITSGSVKAPLAHLGLSNGARAGLTGFVAGLARQVARHNVTINGLLPGQFQTDRLNSMLAEAMQKTGKPAEEILAERTADIPAARFGEPAEFGEACAFLCAASSGYIVGQNLLIDGGRFNSTLG